MRQKISAARRKGQGGYALLLVYVMAASIAISLYMEMPRVTFEAQRAKEQVLVNRGQQYVTAIRRFYVKFQRFPAKIEDLENTNNIRFLRRRYVDPMTGKDEWRLIHVGPGGMLTDSLVQKAGGLGQGLGPGQGGPGQAVGANPGQGFGQNGFGNPGGAGAQQLAGQQQGQAQSQLQGQPDADPGGVNIALARRPSDHMPGEGISPTPTDGDQADNQNGGDEEQAAAEANANAGGDAQQAGAQSDDSDPNQTNNVQASNGQPNNNGLPNDQPDPNQANNNQGDNNGAPGQPGSPNQQGLNGQPGFPNQPQSGFGQPGYPNQQFGGQPGFQPAGFGGQTGAMPFQQRFPGRFPAGGANFPNSPYQNGLPQGNGFQQNNGFPPAGGFQQNNGFPQNGGFTPNNGFPNNQFQNGQNPNSGFPQGGDNSGDPSNGNGGAPAPGMNPGLQAVQNQLTGQTAQTNSPFGQGNTPFGGGQSVGGGIAGVASKVARRGIKEFDKHKKYNEWEFVFDMKKLTGIPGQAPQFGQGQPGQTGQSTPFGQAAGQNGPFGQQQGQGQNGFGNTGFGNSGFGATPGQGGTGPQTPTQPQQNGPND
jgi:hypothetical protein